MKKILLGIVSLFLLGSVASAAFTSMSVSTNSASALLTAAGSAEMMVELRDIVGAGYGVSVSSIYWSGITVGVTDFKAADTVLVVHATSTVTNWGIRIYTDNKDGSANPQYTGTGDPAGLVAGDDGAITLPMCWRITANTTDTLNILEDGSNKLYEQSLGSSYNCYVWMQDFNTTGFYSDDYAVIWNENGIHHAEGANWGASASPNFIYLGAKFTNATSPRTYSTNQLKVELYCE
ncbi:MAG: hypothetical protein ABH857_01475 [Elusimicrobiota bacterium]